MVLAAGQGTRLRPTTDRTPKALVPVAGRPMIEYALLLLRHYDIQDIVINLHHFGEQIENRLGDGERLGVKINYSREPNCSIPAADFSKQNRFCKTAPLSSSIQTR